MQIHVLGSQLQTLYDVMCIAETMFKVLACKICGSESPGLHLQFYRWRIWVQNAPDISSWKEIRSTLNLRIPQSLIRKYSCDSRMSYQSLVFQNLLNFEFPPCLSVNYFIPYQVKIHIL